MATSEERDLQRKQSIKAAREYRAQASKNAAMIEKDRDPGMRAQASIAFSLLALVTIALAHEREDD